MTYNHNFFEGGNMVRTVTIHNYKSIQEITLELGQINVLIGENGAGKSNILEAITLCSAAVARKLDNEFLTSRGIRVTDPIFMRSAFDAEQTTCPIKLSVRSDIEELNYSLDNDNGPYSKWTRTRISVKDTSEAFSSLIEGTTNTNEPLIEELMRITIMQNFIIYSPENSALRTFEKEGQIEPLGINGEGLLKLLWVINQSKDKQKVKTIKNMLRLAGWFDDFEIPFDQLGGDSYLRIRDRFIDSDLNMYTQRSASEGLLFLLFYAALFVSDDTPKFFAIDNIDASLNPKLCTRLIQEIVQLAKKYDKQVILTTHNPAILDGLNLDDEAQRLLVVSRNKIGHTQIHTIQKPRTLEGEEPIKLSEAFLNGMIGGLPKSF
jgi:predicted ATPase